MSTARNMSKSATPTGGLHHPEGRQPLAAAVARQLREAIASGAWEIGQRIPTESELMERFQVSRGTLREGIKALAHAGVLEVRQGDGTYVRARSELEGTASRSVGEHTAAHVFEVRQVLDTQAARLAALRAEAPGIEELQRILDASLDAWHAGRVSEWADLDWEFHRGVARLSGNPLLEQLYSGFAGAFKRDLLNQSEHRDFDPSLQPGHQDLITALSSGDPETAERSVRCGLEIAESRS
ncbi:FadR/GntR family transcriptional regulator [Arthrobacter woluwensis]|uniref:FadR/GntR family transcriptional regulator n=1 Tax=Arthrobacter woluwensis TaxID=156980 RepID=UPI00381B8434